MSDTARDQAIAQYGSIAELVAALECDYERLEELREQKEHHDERDEWAAIHPDDAQELEDLENAAGETEDADRARQDIEEDALSVEIRSGWQSADETLEAAEFCILLCTGGPAVRVRGELDEYREPSRAWIEYQDWGTPWTMLHDECVDTGTLLTYCQCFYFGE